VCDFASSENKDRVEGTGDSGRASSPFNADTSDPRDPSIKGGPVGHFKDSSEVSRELGD
jgi:hypothetical protein